MAKESTDNKNKTPTSYDIVPVVGIEKIKEAFEKDSSGDTPYQIIEKIILDMKDIYPEGSLDIPVILEDLVSSSLSSLGFKIDYVPLGGRDLLSPHKLNKIWVENNEVAGYLIFEDKGDGELYILSFGVKKRDESLPLTLLLGNIIKTIKTARKKGYKKVSLNGFNEQLNRILIKKFGFQEAENPYTDNPNPYLILNLEKSKDNGSLEKIESPEKERIDLSGLKSLLKDRVSEMTNEQWEVVDLKVRQYLNKIREEFPPRGWSTLADAIKDSFDGVVSGNMGIDAAIKAHDMKVSSAIKNMRRELAEDPASKPELLVSSGEMSLFNLNNHNQLKQESVDMTHCVGDDDFYIKKIVEGTRQIWSLRREGGNPELTIEYDVKKNHILQMKMENDDLLTGEEEWLEDLLKIFKKLSELNPPIVIKNFQDIDEIFLETSEVITPLGERFTIDDLEKNNVESVFAGRVVLHNEMSPERIQKLCQIRGLSVHTSFLSEENKDLITHVAGNLKDRSDISFNNLESVEGNVDFFGSRFKNLKSLKNIGGVARFSGSKIENLENLINIGGDAHFTGSIINNLEKLKSVGGDARFLNSKIENLENLEIIGGDIWLNNSEITGLPSLKTIGGSIVLQHSKIKELPSLETIGRGAWFDDSEITGLPSLKTIGINASFSRSKIRKLPSLELIGGNAFFKNSLIEDLSSLRNIGGSADFTDSKIIEWSHIEIGGEIYASEKLRLENAARRAFLGK